MNAKKISKFIFAFAGVFFFFAYSYSAFATTSQVESYKSGDHIYCIDISDLPVWYPLQGGGYVQFWNWVYTSNTFFDFSGTPTLIHGSNATQVVGGSSSWTTLTIPEAEYCFDMTGYETQDYIYIVYTGRDAGYEGATQAWPSITWNTPYQNTYYGYFYEGVPVPPTPPVSHIESFSYSTTTAEATITGYWIATTTPYITERLSFWQYSTSLGQESYEQLTATTTGVFSFTFSFLDPYSWTSGESSTTPIYSSFTLNASLDQYDETNEVWPYGGEVIDNLDATSTTISAAVYNASDFISTPRALALYPEYECGITSMMGCIKNAAIWLFYPTQDALDNWQTLKSVLETKAPVGYFYMTKNAIGGLSATSTPSFSLTIPAHLKQYIFDPFDIGIAGILWFFFIFHFYKRLKHIQI